MKTVKPVMLAVAAALALGSGPVRAQEVVLKLHHFLPPQATIQAQVFNPWCEKVGRESGGKIKCQIYPAMQLGGTPPQLFDQAKDGVADIVWTLPTYQAGPLRQVRSVRTAVHGEKRGNGQPRAVGLRAQELAGRVQGREDSGAAPARRLAAPLLEASG